MFLCHAKVNSRPPPARPAHYWTVALGRCLKGATTSKSTSLACWWKFCFKTEPVKLKSYFKKNYNIKLYWNNIANYFFVSPSDCLIILKRLHNNGKYDFKTIDKVSWMPVVFSSRNIFEYVNVAKRIIFFGVCSFVFNILNTWVV